MKNNDVETNDLLKKSEEEELRQRERENRGKPSANKKQIKSGKFPQRVWPTDQEKDKGPKA